MDANIGISKTQLKTMSETLGHALADTFTLYLKTHGFHWNVTGPMFAELHTLFETQYTDLWEAADALAERMRYLGYPALGSGHEFHKNTQLKEAMSVPSANEMLKALLTDNETVARSCHEWIKAANEAGDDGTADLLTQRKQIHEKNAWMLRSLLGN